MTPHVGQALFMCPEVLVDGGARVWCPDRRCRGVHAFVCAHANDRAGLWVPLFSRPGPGRFELPVAGRYGHPTWVYGVWHYHQEQAWVISHDLAADAARVAGDKSRPDSPNGIRGLSAKCKLWQGKRVIWLAPASATIEAVPA